MATGKDFEGYELSPAHPGVIFRTGMKSSPAALTVGRVFFGSWEYRNKTEQYGMTTFEPISDDYLVRTKINSSNWEQQVLKSTELTLLRTGNYGPEAGKKPVPFSSMDASGRVGKFFRRSFGFSSALNNETTTDQLLVVQKEHKNYVRRLADDIKKTGDLRFLADLAREFTKAEVADPRSQALFMAGVDIRAVHLLIGSHDKFLAGVNEGKAVWQRGI